MLEIFEVWFLCYKPLIPILNGWKNTCSVHSNFFKIWMYHRIERPKPWKIFWYCCNGTLSWKTSSSTLSHLSWVRVSWGCCGDHCTALYGSVMHCNVCTVCTVYPSQLCPCHAPILVMCRWCAKMSMTFIYR